ncbi:MAG: hypothetical protein COA96_14920 [SAR86 cluster bacterium]|uniref:3-keto-alpha-glucoside-1,2-lyase/3-keto-2-hydroxy-glucal hydratase domain-containing protein n=1 Tax=SAR86 cluster bacterium TaxID=2030880 RepID=A0A2A5ASE2_9GAMM|nr:MAG: hypothetical protein COA96_14920 [SAR86 cluster bacterium]
MRKLIIALLSIGVSSQLVAQANDRGEIYQPVPAKVTGVGHGIAPSDAIVLFDGSDLDAWQIADSEEAAAWDIEDGVVTVKKGAGTIKTRQRFGDIQLHVEWRPTDNVQGDGQGRGNSGIFLHSLYEVQILDSWNNPTYINGQAGSIYKQHIPLVNVSKPPGEWQSYDIIFKAPVYAVTGVLESPAYVTLMQNGVLVLNHAEILGATFTLEPEYTIRCEPYSQSREQDCSGKMPISLQDHGQIVSYRNIWVREL